MIRPRWQGLNRAVRPNHWRRWDQLIAMAAALNLVWVIFDVSYIPLRNFWLQRNLYPLPTLPLVVPLPWLPNITPAYDRIKGIEPHLDSRAYLDQFGALDQALLKAGPSDHSIEPLL
ncbi:MAG: hypothetical protein O2972_05070, partial [Cyanobacteria bacterium]|nr:hypothetical protein [Cyanobacteriota bacterium]